MLRAEPQLEDGKCRRRGIAQLELGGDAYHVKGPGAQKGRRAYAAELVGLRRVEDLAAQLLVGGGQQERVITALGRGGSPPPERSPSACVEMERLGGGRVVKRVLEQGVDFARGRCAPSGSGRTGRRTPRR